MGRSRPATWGDAASARDELHRSKREAILRMAARMFAEEGFAATSLAAIAERLNVTKPTLYYYIRNKDEILDACVERGLETVRANIAQAHDGDPDGHDKLRRFFRAHAEFILDDFGVLLVAARQDLSRAHRRQLKQVDSAVIELIEEGIADGSLRECDPGLACFVLFGAFNAIPTWFQAKGRYSREAVVDTYFDLLFEGIAR